MISYIRDEADKIKSITIANWREICLVNERPDDCVYAGTYSAEEISFAFKVLIHKEDCTLFYVEPTEDGFRLYIGRTSYEPYQQSISSAIYGSIEAYRYLNGSN